MHSILVAGAGKIGLLIACLLAESGAYKVVLSDLDMSKFNLNLLGNQQKNIQLVSMDATDRGAFNDAVKRYQIESVVSSLPYFCNKVIAEGAREHHLNYFDLTEDTDVTETVASLAVGAQRAFVPQCGLAPGFISIAANDLMKRFERVEKVFLRVGALPVFPNNVLKYSLTWSTDGLINEYGNACYGIENGQEVSLKPLEGLETIQVDGLLYEAFNTSGGLGSLFKTHAGKVKEMNYKTIRYPGHCEHMRFLMNDLQLNDDRQMLKTIFERVLPKTKQDVVLVYVAAVGYQDNQLVEETYFRKILPADIAGRKWSAIQVTTAASLCAVVDLVVHASKPYQALILQEDFALKDILSNRFGKYYA